MIASRFRQRGNIVSFLDPSPPPPPPPPAPNASAYGSSEDELSASNPENGGSTPRLDMFWKPDGTRIYSNGQGLEMAQNDVSPPWSIIPLWTNRVQTANVTNIRSIWWSPDGTRLSACARVPSFAFRVFVWDQSATPFDLTVLGSNSLVTLGIGTSGGPADHIWSADGLRCWVHYQESFVHQILEYATSTPFDPTGLGPATVARFDMFPDTGTGVRTITFSTDGTVMYAMSLQVLVSWDLSIPFDITTMANFTTGPSILSADVGNPRGLTARPDNTDIFVSGDQNQKKVAWFRLPLPPLDIDPDIDEYILTSSAVSTTLIANNHLTPYFNLAGTRVYFARASVFQTLQYALTTPGDLSTMTGNFEGGQNWLVTTQFMRSISLSPDRAKAYKIRRSGATDILISADPFSVSALGDPAQNPYQLLNTKNSSTITLPVNPGAFVVAPNNADVFIASKDVSDRQIYHFQMSVAGDASTLTPQTFVLDLNAKFSTQILGIIYSPSGDKLFIMGDNGGTLSIVQFDMSVAFDVTTAVDSGKQITITPAFTVNLSLFVWKNPLGGFKLYTTYMDNDDINATDLAFDLYDAP